MVPWGWEPDNQAGMPLRFHGQFRAGSHITRASSEFRTQTQIKRAGFFCWVVTHLKSRQEVLTDICHVDQQRIAVLKIIGWCCDNNILATLWDPDTYCIGRHRDCGLDVFSPCDVYETKDMNCTLLLKSYYFRYLVFFQLWKHSAVTLTLHQQSSREWTGPPD